MDTGGLISPLAVGDCLSVWPDTFTTSVCVVLEEQGTNMSLGAGTEACMVRVVVILRL